MVDHIPWDTFKQRFRWTVGEHVTAIAPTGAGKTTLFKALADYRKYSLFFGTKMDDPLYRDLMKKGFRRIDTVSDIKGYDEKLLLWPKPQKTILETRAHQSQVFRDALNAIVKHGGWTVWFDEAKYMVQQLRLGDELTFAYEQLRSINATIISGAQRPAFLPLSALSNASHVFLWKSNLDTDAKRLADIGGIDAKAIAHEARTLGSHEFLYIHTRGTQTELARSQAPR